MEETKQLSKQEARKLTEEIRETAGRLDQLLKRAYAEGAWQVLGYEAWSDYIDGEFAELPKQRRYEWRAYGQVSDVTGNAGVTVNQATAIRPHLELVKERIEEKGAETPEEKLEVAKAVVTEQKSKAHNYPTAACRIRPPEEMLERVDYYLEAVLDPNRYELSIRDKDRLRRTLRSSLRKLETENAAAS